jgi:hypothetical protein
MPVSLSGLETRVLGWNRVGWRRPPDGSRIGWVDPIDKSKFADFKPLSLDVIFHDCKIGDASERNFDAFAR